MSFGERQEKLDCLYMSLKSLLLMLEIFESFLNLNSCWLPGTSFGVRQKTGRTV